MTNDLFAKRQHARCLPELLIQDNITKCGSLACNLQKVGHSIHDQRNQFNIESLINIDADLDM
jgi:hypothetical protein